ncbi:MAG TPA: DUF6504 family protein [Thermaerobacter sp.]
MRIVDQPVEVTADRDGRPLAFTWRGRRHVIEEVLEAWKELGEWWDQDPAEDRSVFRVQAGGCVYELDYRRPQGRWFLYCIFD